MVYKINSELQSICDEILKMNKSLEEWREIESTDMFQSDNISGGFDAIEMEFCFSVYVNNEEYWLQISLNEINEISKGIVRSVLIERSE